MDVLYEGKKNIRENSIQRYLDKMKKRKNVLKYINKCDKKENLCNIGKKMFCFV